MEKQGEFFNNPLSSLNAITSVNTATPSTPTPAKINVKQEEIHDLLFSREIDWQEIIYDLINTEQLNPWDIDLIVLTEKYFQRIQEMEERDFFVSSKVLLAASFLLRIKSEILLNKYIKSIDEILFGNKSEIKKPSLERIELEDEIPELIPRSPLPRFKKVTLKELLESLNKAIITENRRIKKEIVNKNALRESSISLPKRKFSIKDKIIEITMMLEKHFNSKTDYKKITFTELAGEDREKRIEHFSPLLHLENQKKIWLEQPAHFEEIYIWEKKNYWEKNGDPFRDLITELKEGKYTEDSISDEEFSKFGENEEEDEEKEQNYDKGYKEKGEEEY
ncbi:MAG: segregation/condensation protein A [Candidatus Pacearchaeota archaeon]|nr:segregation/condensation protein A [Candidatus Pacearchaeota archaeon]